MTSTSTAPIKGLRAHTPRLRAAAIRARAVGQPLSIFVTNDPASAFTDAQVKRMVDACQLQLCRDVAPEFGIPEPTVTFLAHGTPVLPVSTWTNYVAVLGVVPHIPLDPNAQGWHQPLGVGSARKQLDGYISTERLDADGLSECLGHELVETTVDPACDAAYQGADGSLRPEEPCDACQAGGLDPNSFRVPFDMRDGQPPVQLPNFCTKAWGLVGDTSGAKKDYLGLLPTNQDFPVGPFGYCAVTSPDGTTTNVFGNTGDPVTLPDHKQNADARIQFVLAKMRERAAAAQPSTSPTP